MAKKSNFDKLVDEYYEYFGMVYEDDRTGERYRFLGILYGHDDLYYAMNNIEDGGLVLLTCVGSLEGFNFRRLDDYVETRCPWCGNDSLTLEVYSDKFGINDCLVEGLEHYVCSNGCINDYETPQQLRAKHDKIIKSREKIKKGV